MNIPKPKYEVHVDGAPYQVFDNVSSAIDYASRHLYISKEYGSVDDICDRIESGKTFTFSYGFKTGVIIPKDTHLMRLYRAAPEMLEFVRLFDRDLHCDADQINGNHSTPCWACSARSILYKVEGQK